MNFIFGIIILALFLLALRVIGITLLQSIEVLHVGIKHLHVKLAQRRTRVNTPVVLAQLPSDTHWEAMAESVRREIQQRNFGRNSDVERLEAQLQARLKTIELIKVDIQIAKLEQELFKIKPALATQVAEPDSKRKRTKSVTAVELDEQALKAAHPVNQLRAALKGNNVAMTPVSELARH